MISGYFRRRFSWTNPEPSPRQGRGRWFRSPTSPSSRPKRVTCLCHLAPTAPRGNGGKRGESRKWWRKRMEKIGRERRTCLMFGRFFSEDQWWRWMMADLKKGVLSSASVDLSWRNGDMNQIVKIQPEVKVPQSHYIGRYWYTVSGLFGCMGLVWLHRLRNIWVNGYIVTISLQHHWNDGWKEPSVNYCNLPR